MSDFIDNRHKKNKTPISPRTRFKVLNRDGYKCQYCGQTSDNTVLEIDHIIPRAEGGTNSIDNLITSCRICNLGKSNKFTKANIEYTSFDKIISDILLSVIHSNEMFGFTVKNFIKYRYHSNIRVLATECDVPESTLYKILSGTRTVSIQTLRKMINGFEQLELKEVDDE